jgi:hypothetical protein
MLLSNTLAAAALLLPAVSATELLDGYGRESFSLPCGWGCRYAMPSNLDCPEYAGMTPEEKAEQYPSAACMANDTSYLTSFAWCINSYCPKTIRGYKILKFWETDMIYGQNEPGVVLRYSYSEALKLVDPKKPPKPMNATIETVFNRTISISPEEYEANMNGVKGYRAVGKNESTYR